jgi:uncharacterized protein
MTADRSLRVHVVSGRYAVCRLEAHAPIPEWARGPSFVSITRTPDELSIVCEEANVPRGQRAERGYAMLMIEGPLAPEMVGVMMSLITPLADVGVSIFAISTFDTDYVLVRASHLERAVEAIRRAGHTVV